MTDSLSLKARKKTEEFILQGILKAGDKITERDLAERLGMSRAPVREAIRAHRGRTPRTNQCPTNCRTSVTAVRG